MAKKKKHQPEAEEEQPKPFRFLNSVQWNWTGFEWVDPALGSWWLGHLRNRVYKFNFDHYDEFGLLDSWCTIDHAERMILDCAKHPVFSVDPSPMFLQRWLDTWVENLYCRLWCHVFDTLRLKNGVEEFDAAYRADVVASEFEQLFDPTFPRFPKAMKPRRGSKRDKTMSEPTTHAKDPEPTPAPGHQPEDYIELRGPDPSPYTAFQYCYRVLDRRDIQPKVQNIPGSEGRFYEGIRVAAMILGNNINDAQIAADAAFREVKRRVVYERLQAAGEPQNQPAEPAVDVAGTPEA